MKKYISRQIFTCVYIETMVNFGKSDNIRTIRRQVIKPNIDN